MSKPSIVGDRLRIFVISFAFLPYIGGSEMQALKHARQLQALGHDVTILTVRIEKQWPKTETIDGLPVIRVGGGIYRRNGMLRMGKPGRPFIDLAMFLTLWQIRHQFDVIHVMQMSSIAAVATLVCKLAHKSIVISVQSAGPNKEQQKRIDQRGIWLMADTLPETSDLQISDKDWIAGDIENVARSIIGGRTVINLLKQSDAYYQVLSTRSRAYLIENGFRSEQIVNIPNAIDMEKFRPAAQRPDPAKPERDIICVARLEYPKGVDVLLHAWGRMMNAPSEWRTHLKPRLHVVGKGVFRPQMERIVAALGIQDSVEFLGLRTDVSDLLPQAWGFVLPSRWEGMPNALLEGMACGLPCVATRVSGSEDIITDGVNGLLVEPEQPAEMAQALRRIIEDDDLARRLGQEARATVLRDYQISTITDRCLQLYREIRSEGQQVLPLALQGRGKM
jgi:glycosyltransferase involved in cell wall biosynthesis